MKPPLFFFTFSLEINPLYNFSSTNIYGVLYENMMHLTGFSEDMHPLWKHFKILKFSVFHPNLNGYVEKLQLIPISLYSSIVFRKLSVINHCKKFSLRNECVQRDILYYITLHQPIEDGKHLGVSFIGYLQWKIGNLNSLSCIYGSSLKNTMYVHFWEAQQSFYIIKS